jgi:quercetin dioxygenase-like cupin family protein
MIASKLNELELLEAWAEEDSDIRVKFTAPISSASGTASTQLVYFTLEPEKRAGRHSHSAESTLLILEGMVELSMGNERQQFSAGEVAFARPG